MWFEIRIRKLRYEQARSKLETEIHRAFLRGEKYIEIIHGIGSYTLRGMTLEYLASLDFVKILPQESSFNPGSLKIELEIPGKDEIKRYLA